MEYFKQKIKAGVGSSVLTQGVNPIDLKITGRKFRNCQYYFEHLSANYQYHDYDLTDSTVLRNNMFQLVMPIAFGSYFKGLNKLL
jgi:adenylosuccinate lyase